MIDNREPDALEKGVRFGCGVAFAVPLALYATWGMVGSLTTGWIAGIAGFALLIGLLAMIFGDRFWHVLLHLFSLW